jgi:hypothetical protein
MRPDLACGCSHSRAGSNSHLKSIIRPGENTLDAEQVVQVCQGMCTLAIATVTRRGEPRISGADGHPAEVDNFRRTDLGAK